MMNTMSGAPIASPNSGPGLVNFALFSIGNAGASPAFGFDSNGGLSLTLPDAGTGATAGLITNAAQTISGAKTFVSQIRGEFGDNSGNAIVILSNNSTSTTTDVRVLRCIVAGTGVNNGFIRFENGGGTLIGSVAGATSGSVAYNTTSDRRLKKDIKDFTGALALLKKVKPRSFTWKKGETEDRGFIAQELKEVYPFAVFGEEETEPKEEEMFEPYVDDAGNEGMIKVKKLQLPEEHSPMSVDYSKLTPLLTAAIKELMSEVETLKEKITKLEKK